MCVDAPRMSDEEKEQYVQNFDLSTSFDPRLPGLYRSLLLPASWFIPSEQERHSGGSCYKYTGAAWLRVALKAFPCYPRTIHGTHRHTVERERALILTVPLTIKYELGHVWGGIMHTIIATVFIVLTANYIVWGINYLLIYVVHVLPCCVQRMNRAQLYTAIEDFRNSAATSATHEETSVQAELPTVETETAAIAPSVAPESVGQP